ncbi:MAG: glycolate oxidase subunit GlcF [Rhodospirillales bacterium]|nr:glycolate oxidase subunit GlcF [Rhodospirillales bacterium]
MRTEIPAALAQNPAVAEMVAILGKCVHCGFCLTACPTYAELGDERDSPRGRIYLIKDMIETGGAPDKGVVGHLDKCLSCLACVSACPSSVDYQNYIDLARAHVETVHRRSPIERCLRIILSMILPHAGRARLFLRLGSLAKPFKGLFGRRLAVLLEHIPDNLSKGALYGKSQTFPVQGSPGKRAALLPGCVQQALRQNINEATIRLLNRLGVEVVIAENTVCCGALDLHLGRDDKAREYARANVQAWESAGAGGDIDFIVANAAGCGTQIKHYGQLLGGEDNVPAPAHDITEVVADLGLPEIRQFEKPIVIYHDACSLLHGQGISKQPRDLLVEAGFQLKEIPGRHFCCGSAGTYNLLQPEMADRLIARRLEAVSGVRSEGAVIATGNIGCMEQFRSNTDIPVVHTVELLDWATGGPRPPGV